MTRKVVLIGDIHGHYKSLLQLWRNLEIQLGRDQFEKCTVIFLGDFNDRGPDTKLVFDWLVKLDNKYPDQKHVYLYGNHDFSFAAFIGALPPTSPPDFNWSTTWEPLLPEEYREGWWTGEGVESMHIQGRRWGGTIKDKVAKRTGKPYKGSTYDAGTTFESYGVKHGDREGLLAAVPEAHKDFLRNKMTFIHEEDGIDTGEPETSYSQLVAIHAGIEKDKKLEPQLEILRKRDVTSYRLEALSGRKNVWEMHPDFAKQNVLLVSGHHGVLDTSERNRLIIDEGGGVEGQPIAAMILPERTIVRHTDVFA